MPRAKRSKRKAALVHYRMDAGDKDALEKYAVAPGMTLSELLRMTTKNLVAVIGSKPPES